MSFGFFPFPLSPLSPDANGGCWTWEGRIPPSSVPVLSWTDGWMDGWILGRPSTSRVVLPSTPSTPDPIIPPVPPSFRNRVRVPFEREAGETVHSVGSRPCWTLVDSRNEHPRARGSHVFFDASSTATTSLETRPAAIPCIPCKHLHLHQRTYATNHTDQPDAAAVRGRGGGRARGEASRQPAPTSRTCMRRLLHGCVNTCFPNGRPRHVAIIGSFDPGGEDPRREHARVGVAPISRRCSRTRARVGAQARSHATSVLSGSRERCKARA